MENKIRYRLVVPPKNLIIPASVWGPLKNIEVIARKTEEGVLVNTRYLTRILRNTQKPWLNAIGVFLQKDAGVNLLF